MHFWSSIISVSWDAKSYLAGEKSVKPYLLNQMQLGTLLEQGMLIYISLLYVNCKIVKT